MHVIHVNVRVAPVHSSHGDHGNCYGSWNERSGPSETKTENTHHVPGQQVRWQQTETLLHWPHWPELLSSGVSDDAASCRWWVWQDDRMTAAGDRIQKLVILGGNRQIWVINIVKWYMDEGDRQLRVINTPWNDTWTKVIGRYRPVINTPSNDSWTKVIGRYRW